MLRSNLTRVAFALAILLPLAPALGKDASDKVKKKEDAVLQQIADELLRLGRSCAQQKAFSDARAELERGLVFTPGSKKLEDELKKLEGKGGGSVPAKLEADRTKALEKCANLLVEVA